MKNFSELADYIISLEKEVEKNKETIRSQVNEIHSLTDDLGYSSKIEYDLRNKVSDLTKCIDDLNAKIEKLEGTYDPFRDELRKFMSDEWSQLHKRYWDVPYGNNESLRILGAMEAYDNILKRFYSDEY